MSFLKDKVCIFQNSNLPFSEKDSVLSMLQFRLFWPTLKKKIIAKKNVFSQK